MLPVKAYSNSDRKEEMCGKKKKEIVVFFQISLESKQIKQYFLEWAKHHSNRWQKCRHAREQVYKLTYGYVFNGMLKQQLLENYFNSYIYRTLSLPGYLEACLKWTWILFPDFYFQYFDRHLKISLTNIYLNGREVAICYFIIIFPFYYFKLINYLLF